MTLKDIKQLPTLQTRSIAEAARDPATAFYLITCLNKFYAGDYGLICAEDTAANEER